MNQADIKPLSVKQVRTGMLQLLAEASPMHARVSDRGNRASHNVDNSVKPNATHKRTQQL